MNFKDRGNKKWTAMMLIEHRTKLRKLKESEKDRKKPILDDQEKEVINSKMQQALHNNMTVEIKYYEDKRFKKIIGKIDKVDTNQGYIFITKKKIPTKSLLELKLK